jgi:hypothetical protein
MRQEARTGTYFKIGYTSNIFKRVIPYATHNANAELLEIVETYKKTKMTLETEIHNEVIKMGYEFQTKKILGIEIQTEWFFVPMDKEQEFVQAGLSQFKSCKNRKIYKVTH